jgi:hypothetical protein
MERRRPGERAWIALGGADRREGEQHIAQADSRRHQRPAQLDQTKTVATKGHRAELRRQSASVWLKASQASRLVGMTSRPLDYWAENGTLARPRTVQTVKF